MSKQIFTIKIGGQAGQGVKSAGLMLAKVANRLGYYIFNYTEYPSLIRGGHNIIQVSFSQEEVLAPTQKINLLIALNKETVDLHLHELEEGGGIIFDGGDDFKLPTNNKKINFFHLPLSELATKSGEKELFINTVASGAVMALLGSPLPVLNQLLSEEFTNKGSQMIEANLQAAQAGYDYALAHFANHLQSILTPLENTTSKMMVNGNEAVGMGAIAGGVQFVSIYPMTPITNLLHFLALHDQKYGYIYKQPEDEIAAINMAIGASFAGARAMTATSGGGFCLMSEGYGLAGISETPVVIIEGMRGGPATGLPTWSEQGDLQFVLHAHQGEFPRLVLAPGDAQEAFLLTEQAFNLADKYQTPVVVLVDKNICESDQSFPLFKTTGEIARGKFTLEFTPDYQRFAPTPDGISPRSIPGSGNFFIATSYEHDSQGLTTEQVDQRQIQMTKRMSKLQTCQEEDLPLPQLSGPQEAEITLVSWGSNKGAILQAIRQFPNVNFLHLTWLSPFPAAQVKRILEKARHIVDIECNYTGQLANLIREKTGIEIRDKILKIDGRPFFVEEIIQAIGDRLKKGSHYEFKGNGQDKGILSPNLSSLPQSTLETLPKP